jgi:RHS repeat-associated protein
VKLKSGGTLIASYRYDALGRRVEKSVVSGSFVERYIRATVENPGHWENISHVVSTFDGSDNWQQNFVWNDEVDGITMLEQADVLDYDTDTNTSEVTRSFYHRNALGSVMEITDMNQAKVASYRYDPYGSVTITVGGTPQANDPLGQHWAFTGRFLDEESRLLYYRARYYDPGTGRFLQRDPLGCDVGPNLYEYVGSHVPNSSDPSGLQEAPKDKKKKAATFGNAPTKDYFGRGQPFLDLLRRRRLIREARRYIDRAIKKLEDDIKLHEPDPYPVIAAPAQIGPTHIFHEDFARDLLKKWKEAQKRIHDLYERPLDKPPSEKETDDAWQDGRSAHVVAKAERWREDP